LSIDCSEILLKEYRRDLQCCIWCCIQPQADQNVGVDRMQFKESIGGEAIAAGKEVWRLSWWIFPRRETCLIDHPGRREGGTSTCQTRTEQGMAEMTVEQIDKRREATIWNWSDRTC
jgi:hypothetical protein